MHLGDGAGDGLDAGDGARDVAALVWPSGHRPDPGRPRRRRRRRRKRRRAAETGDPYGAATSAPPLNVAHRTDSAPVMGHRSSPWPWVVLLAVVLGWWASPVSHGPWQRARWWAVVVTLGCSSGPTEGRCGWARRAAYLGYTVIGHRLGRGRRRGAAGARLALHHRVAALPGGLCSYFVSGLVPSAVVGPHAGARPLRRRRRAAPADLLQLLQPARGDRLRRAWSRSLAAASHSLTLSFGAHRASTGWPDWGAVAGPRRTRAP